MGRSRDSWEDTKGHLGVQTWIFIDFWWISGLHFERFSGTLNQNWCLFSCLFPGHFSKRFWGLNLDVWCSKNKHLVWERLRKPTFQSWNSVVSSINFWCFLVDLGPIFMTFDALETGLKFDKFSWLPWGIPDPAPRLLEGNWYCSQAHCQQPDC